MDFKYHAFILVDGEKAFSTKLTYCLVRSPIFRIRLGNLYNIVNILFVVFWRPPKSQRSGAVALLIVPYTNTPLPAARRVAVLS